jgi:4a-hydroxytetrahydrobiopterin dehydratase
MTAESPGARSATLDDVTVQRWLEAHAGWEQVNREIARSVECASFPAALALVQQVGEEAERRDHHPDIDIRWRTLHLALSTHSEGGITDKDTALAETIDALAGEAAGG